MSQLIAEQLWKARRDGSRVDVSTVNLPRNEEEAYLVQGALTKQLDARLVGFKIGATTEAALKALGLSTAFYAPLFDSYFHGSDAEVPVPREFHVLLEAEIAVGLRCDLAPRNSEYTVEEIAEAVDWIGPCFEVVATRFDMELAGNGILIIADSGINMDLVAGAPISNWDNIDLTMHPVSLQLNGQEVASGHTGLSIFGEPFGAVTWLANHRTMRHRGLKARDVIATGTCTGMTPVRAGDRAYADFGQLGRVDVRFVEA